MNSFNNEFGIMQGRLLPKFQGRYQAHPLGYWEEEFFIGSKIGINLIEFIFDFNDFKKNPLYSLKGQEKIKQISDKTDVKVKTICADYFMSSNLHSLDKKIVKENQQILLDLFESADNLNIEYIVLPCVDNSSLKNLNVRNRFANNLKEILPDILRYNCKISLETDLSPNDFGKLLDVLGRDSVTVNYDTGNSASLGYDPNEEFLVYGDLISDIHIKDRKLGGGPTKLGLGDVDFRNIISLIEKYRYKGPIIFQAFRDEEGISIFLNQLEFFKELLCFDE